MIIRILQCLVKDLMDKFTYFKDKGVHRKMYLHNSFFNNNSLMTNIVLLRSINYQIVSTKVLLFQLLDK